MQSTLCEFFGVRLLLGSRFFQQPHGKMSFLFRSIVGINVQCSFVGAERGLVGGSRIIFATNTEIVAALVSGKLSR